MPGPGNVARASAGITTPSLGSFGGDLAGLAGGFLEGIQEEKERKEKQALEEARIALEADRIEIATDTLAEASRSNLAREDLSADATAVQAQIAGAQVDNAETNAARFEAEEDAVIARTSERTATAAGHRVTLETVYGVSTTVTEGLDVDSLLQMIQEKRAERTREAEIASSMALSSGERLRVTAEMVDTLQTEQMALRAERQDLVGQQADQLAQAIQQGLIMGMPEISEEDGGYEAALEIAALMDPKELQEVLNQQRRIAGLPTIEEEGIDLDSRIEEIEGRLNDARANLQSLMEVQREPGQEIAGATGAPGPGVSGDNQVQEEVPPDAGSPTAIAFSGMYNADVTIAARNLQFLMSQQPPPPGLQDTLAWIASMGKTPEDILAESDQAIADAQAEEEARAAAEEQAGATGHAATNRRPRPPIGEQIEPFLTQPQEERTVLSRSERRKQRAEARLADSEEPEVDPEVQAIEDQVADSAGANVVADANKVVAIDTAQAKLAVLSGTNDLDAAMGGYKILWDLGLGRTDILASIPDAILRKSVADRTSNRISPR